jgi:hypothetical protein
VGIASLSDYLKRFSLQLRDNTEFFLSLFAEIVGGTCVKFNRVILITAPAYPTS